MEEIKLVLAKIISKIKIDTRTIIAIDGVDASGKTYFSKQLKKELVKKGLNVTLISLDDFHNPKIIRYRKGENSAVGFFEDSYDYKTFIKDCIIPFKDFESEIKIKSFDLNSDVQNNQFSSIAKNSLLIVEGIFVHRLQLVDLWDFSIFLDVSFKESLIRNIARSKKAITQKQIESLTKKFNLRYKAGQQIYLKSCNPKIKANVILDNNNFKNPKIVY